jgi:hypothetical protein
MYAVVNQNYNRSEAINDVRVAYGRYSADWCANCHSAMHSELSVVAGGFVHPIRALGSTIAANYNAYVKTGDLTGGTGDKAFTSMVQFQVDNENDNSKLEALTTSTKGPSATDRVNCFSCHRAHASGWDSMTRWTNANEFLVLGEADGTPVYPGIDSPVDDPAAAQGRSQAEIQKTFYDRPANKYSAWQRSLCNKCHVKD